MPSSVLSAATLKIDAYPIAAKRHRARYTQ